MRYISLAALSLISIVGYGQQKKKTVSTIKKNTATTTSTNPLSNKADSVSYAFGTDIGKSLKGLDIDYLKVDLIAKGIDDALKAKPVLLEEKVRTIIQNAITEERERQSVAAKAKEDAFFAENAKVAGMQTTPEGVQYLVLQEGVGSKPKMENELTLHYRGSLLDGTQFDSSYDRNEPLKLSLDRVIRGWQIGIPLMSKGAKYKFFIPSSLGYGPQASGPIPANSTLVFDVELLDFTPHEAE